MVRSCVTSRRASTERGRPDARTPGHHAGAGYYRQTLNRDDARSRAADDGEAIVGHGEMLTPRLCAGLKRRTRFPVSGLMPVVAVPFARLHELHESTRLSLSSVPPRGR